MKIYYTADLHLSHKKIIQYENRPFKTIQEMNETIINNWNKKVHKDDHVYILGDVGFFNSTSPDKSINILKQLKGHKHLIIGNHDKFIKRCDDSIFESMDYYKEIMDKGRLVILMHYPLATYNKQHYGSYHLYGHVHSNMDIIPERLKNDHCFNVGVDVNNFEPMTLDELIENFKQER